MSTTIRVRERTRDRLGAIAAETNRTMTDVVDEALDALERRRFFASFNEGWCRLREDDRAWGEIEAERASQAGALGDHIS